MIGFHRFSIVTIHYLMIWNCEYSICRYPHSSALGWQLVIAPSRTWQFHMIPAHEEFFSFLLYRWKPNPISNRMRQVTDSQWKFLQYIAFVSSSNSRLPWLHWTYSALGSPFGNKLLSLPYPVAMGIRHKEGATTFNFWVNLSVFRSLP